MGNTSIALGEHFEEFIQIIVQEGRYKNVSEAIRAGLRLLELEERKFQNLKKEIQKGFDSGIATDFDPVENLKQLKAKRIKNA